MKKIKNYLGICIVLLCAAMLLPTNAIVSHAADDVWVEDSDDFDIPPGCGFATKKQVCYVEGDAFDTKDVSLQVYYYEDGSIVTYKGKDIVVDTSELPLTEDNTLTKQEEKSLYYLTVSLKSDTRISDTIIIDIYDKEASENDVPYALIVTKEKTCYNVGDTLGLDDLRVTAVSRIWDEDEYGWVFGIRTLEKDEYTVDTSGVDMSKEPGDTIKITYKGEEYAEGELASGTVMIWVQEIPTPEPEQPVTPSTPETPVTPVVPETPGTPETPSTPVATQPSTSAQTGVLIPGNVTGLKVKALGKKKISIKWKKSKNAFAYVVQVSTKKNFKNAKYKIASDPKYTWKNLKKGKTYYVRVKAASFDKVWSPWSTVKKIKVK